MADQPEDQLRTLIVARTKQVLGEIFREMTATTGASDLSPRQKTGYRRLVLESIEAGTGEYLHETVALLENLASAER